MKGKVSSEIDGGVSFLYNQSLDIGTYEIPGLLQSLCILRNDDLRDGNVSIVKKISRLMKVMESTEACN